MLWLSFTPGLAIDFVMTVAALRSICGRARNRVADPAKGSPQQILQGLRWDIHPDRHGADMSRGPIRFAWNSFGVITEQAWLEELQRNDSQFRRHVEPLRLSTGKCPVVDAHREGVRDALGGSMCRHRVRAALAIPIDVHVLRHWQACPEYSDGIPHHVLPCRCGNSFADAAHLTFECRLRVDRELPKPQAEAVQRMLVLFVDTPPRPQPRCTLHAGFRRWAQQTVIEQGEMVEAASDGGVVRGEGPWGASSWGLAVRTRAGTCRCGGAIDGIDRTPPPPPHFTETWAVLQVMVLIEVTQVVRTQMLIDHLNVVRCARKAGTSDLFLPRDS